MKENQRTTLLNRVIFGTIYFDRYKLISPTQEIKWKADTVSSKVLSTQKFDDWLTDDDCLDILVKQNLCNRQIDINITQLEKRIQSLKLELYTNFYTGKVDNIRKILKQTKDRYEQLIRVRHSLDYLTFDGFYDMVCRQYTLCFTLFDNQDKNPFSDISEIDFRFMEYLFKISNDNIVTGEELRLLSRNDPWRNIWNVSRDNPFGKPAIELSDEQRLLILFSKMYDSAYEHPEPPPEEIINDDDAFDGWMMHLREKGKDGKDQGDEVFIPVMSRIDTTGKTKEEIEELMKIEAAKINAMNSPEAARRKESRFKQIKQQGRVSDTDLNDRKLAIQTQQNKLFMNKVKGK